MFYMVISIVVSENHPSFWCSTWLVIADVCNQRKTCNSMWYISERFIAVVCMCFAYDRIVCMSGKYLVFTWQVVCKF